MVTQKNLIFMAIDMGGRRVIVPPLEENVVVFDFFLFSVVLFEK